MNMFGLNNNIKGFGSRSFGTSSDRMFVTNVNTLRNAGLLLGAGVAAGGLLYYMKTDKDDGVDVKEKEARRRTKSAYGYVLGGFAITGAASYAFCEAGLPELIFQTNPWAYVGLSLATTVPLAIGTTVVDYHKNPTLKHVLWGGLNVSMAAGLSTLSILGGPLIAQTCLATGCVVGGLSLLASKAEPGSLQKYEAPLGMGLGGLVALGLGNMIFPMPILANVMLYGGLAVFSGLLLQDTQQLLEAARNKQVFDPINESLNIYLDTISIFRKIALILFDLQKEQKKGRRRGGDDQDI